MEEIRLPHWLRQNQAILKPEPLKKGFVDRNLDRLRAFMEEMVLPRRRSKEGLLQGISAGARIGGLFVLLLAAVLSSKSVVLVGALLLVAVMAALSGLNPLRLFKQRVLPALLFSSFVLLPTLILGFEPQERLVEIELWGYVVAVTEGGVELFALLMLRIAAALSILVLLMSVTDEQELFSGLKALPIPAVVVTMLYMSLKQLFFFIRLAEEVNLARKARLIRHNVHKDETYWFASRVAYFLQRVFRHSRDVSMAMLSRGFRGTIEFVPPSPLGRRDYIFLGFAFFIFFLVVGL